MGSPTLNNGMMPRMADMLTYMKGLKPTNKVGAAFGSYGWSGESVKDIQQYLTDMKLTVVEPGLKLNWRPHHEQLRLAPNSARRSPRPWAALSPPAGCIPRVPTTKTVKKEISARILSPGWRADAGFFLDDLPERKTTTALLGLLPSHLPELKWRAVASLGAVAARQAEKQPEAAREVMRRLVWAMNEESGAVGLDSARAWPR